MSNHAVAVLAYVFSGAIGAGLLIVFGYVLPKFVWRRIVQHRLTVSSQLEAISEDKSRLELQLSRNQDEALGNEHDVELHQLYATVVTQCAAANNSIKNREARRARFYIELARIDCQVLRAAFVKRQLVWTILFDDEALSPTGEWSPKPTFSNSQARGVLVD